MSDHIEDKDFIKTSLKIRFDLYKKVNEKSVNERKPVYEIIDGLLRKQLSQSQKESSW